MTSHELARLLLTKPDLPVIGFAVGQGAGEGSSDPITEVHVGGEEPEEYKKNNWSTGEGSIGLFFF